MSGRHPWKKLVERHQRELEADPERKARYEALEREAKHEADRAVALADLRRARQLTQQQLAQSLQTTQAGISRLEHQADLYLSTLRRYVEAMGGDLELVARFGSERVPFTIGDSDEEPGADAVGVAG